jgi:hypothetical protein
MTSQPFFDAPGGIRQEGNNQTLTFTRTSPTTGTVCWAPVPPNGAGCGTPSGHYAGGVLVGSTSPIGQSEKPVDGTCCYTGDPTLSTQLFAGDMIGAAKVLWSSNIDTTTGCISIEGLDGNCAAYYFAFFAIDNTCRYNQDGIYSYSLPAATFALQCTQGSQCIFSNGARPTDMLTLQSPGSTIDPATQTFPIRINIDGKSNVLVLRGSQLTTYQSLVDEFSTAWQRVGPTPIESATPPHYGEFQYISNKWYQFDGETSRQIFPILSATDPQHPVTGAVWVNSATGELTLWNGAAWVAPVDPVIYFPQDPTVVACDQYWYNGNGARRFDGVAWIDQPTYVSAIDPAAALSLGCNVFWHNGATFSRWNDKTCVWVQVSVLSFPTDPLLVPNGTMLFNPMTLTLQLWNGLVWITQQFVNTTAAPKKPVANDLWFNPSVNQLSKFNGITLAWDVVPVTIAFKPLNNVSIGDLWFDTTIQVLSEYTSTGWTSLASSTYTSSDDPSLAPVVPEGAVWKSGKVWFTRSGSRWDGTNVIEMITDPRQMSAGFWFNTSTATWYQRNGLTWSLVVPTFALAYDPTQPQLGATWFNGTQLYQQTTLTAWAVVPFSTTAIGTIVGQRWLNTQTGTMSIWSGTKWVEQVPPYTIAFKENNDILITSTTCGEPSYIEITDAQILFSLLRLIPNNPVAGLDGKTGTPMYAEVGVGTDGSVDERRAIIDNLYTRLGHPVINVELTRSQMDLAVQKGLDYIRRDSGAGYTRGYFFLDLNPGQQHYTLTSKTVGYNKIVDVLFIYRPRGGFLNSTFGGEIYGQQMLQQLYVSGTFDILTYHLLASYQNVVAKMFASEFQYQWSERTRVLAIKRKIGRGERVLIDAVLERTEQDLLTDRKTKNWIENWALSEAKMVLAEMRGKYTSLPGAGGAISMNGAELKADAQAMQTALKQEIYDYVASDVETWGIGASITRG